MNQTMLKRHLEDLNSANVAISALGRVLGEIQKAEEAWADGERTSCPFKGNNYFKDCLTKGINALSAFVDIKLEMMADEAGIEKPV